MARADMVGFFWDDTPPPPPPKAEKPKRTPPERVWERPDYLPNLEEALAFNVDLATDQDIFEAFSRRDRHTFDIESYSNYFLLAMRSIRTKKVIYFEQWDGGPAMDLQKLAWVLTNLQIVGFNSSAYDIVIAALAVAGCSPAQLKEATGLIIEQNMWPGEVLKKYKVKALKSDHIDLIEVAPLRASLKSYAGRLHAQRMQDLPFPPHVVLSMEQIAIVRWYCINDLRNTEILHDALLDQIVLREKLSLEYGMDLRSRSDAQIAEHVIGSEVAKLNRARAQRPQIVPGTTYKYRPPRFLHFQTPLMQWALQRIANANFVVAENGKIVEPPELKEMVLTLGEGVYRMGIGGLHSSESCVSHVADDHTLLIDRDVASYYPAIILNCHLYPHHLTPNFLHVYKQLVDRRLAAKHSGNKVVADSLKITINGTFGKLGNPYSILYSPDLLIQVTVTGQLSLLMLIEALEIQDITVVSANTDGIMIKCPTSKADALNATIKWWETLTAFETEETQYQAIYSKDVNNYIALKKDGGMKGKGAYARVGLQKNPSNEICVEAVLALLQHKTPLRATIEACKDIRKFVNIRTVKGGAVKNGVYLGKSIRWYYAVGEEGEIVYAINGNTVPRTTGAVPMMDLPAEFPSNVNFEWYLEEAERILADIGYQQV